MAIDMRRASMWALGAAAVAVLALANLFGRELNALFLQWPGIDKVLHVLGSLALFVGIFVSAGRWRPAARLRLAAAGTVAVAVLDEAVQAIAPGRTVDAFDLVASLAGMTLAFVVVAPRRSRLVWALGAAALAAAALTVWDTHRTMRDYTLALQFERAHDFDRARDHYRRAVANGLRTPAVYNGLAWVEVESARGDAASAVTYARLALDAEPDNADILDTYGWALHHAGRSEDALAPLLAAYAAKPDMYCIHYHLGRVYLALGRHELAATHLRQQVARAGTREAVLAARDLAQIEGER